MDPFEFKSFRFPPLNSTQGRGGWKGKIGFWEEVVGPNFNPDRWSSLYGKTSPSPEDLIKVCYYSTTQSSPFLDIEWIRDETAPMRAGGVRMVEISKHKARVGYALLRDHYRDWSTSKGVKNGEAVSAWAARLEYVEACLQPQTRGRVSRQVFPLTMLPPSVIAMFESEVKGMERGKVWAPGAA